MLKVHRTAAVIGDRPTRRRRAAATTTALRSVTSAIGSGDRIGIRLGVGLGVGRLGIRVGVRIGFGDRASPRAALPSRPTTH